VAGNGTCRLNEHMPAVSWLQSLMTQLGLIWKAEGLGTCCCQLVAWYPAERWAERERGQAQELNSRPPWVIRKRQTQTWHWVIRKRQTHTDFAFESMHKLEIVP
jgi:hypothetical protein